ncbi:MAG: HAD family hydrolase, partial [Candidatus Hydrogenedentales bacterium]
MSAADRGPTRRYVPGTDIEVLHDPPRGRFRHVLFDFDGTISLLREGWQGIMRPVMLEMIAGEEAPTLEMEAEVDAYIEDSTGIQTLVQMHHLVTLVRKYGRVADDQVQEPAAYKAIYNARLMDPVNARLARIASGAAPVDDFTVRGAREFVAALAARGLTLYIFSGTDVEDVRN